MTEGTQTDHETLIPQAEEAYNRESLHDALERIMNWHSLNNPVTASALLPGLSESEMHWITRGLPLTFPKEVGDLYAWRNGTRHDLDRPFIWHHEFLSLETAVREYHQLVRNKRLTHWHDSWFPLLGFQGEYYFVHCAKIPRRAVPVLKYFIEEPEVFASYTNLTTMMLTAAECFETGAVYLAHENGALGEDIHKVRDIHGKHNPGKPFPYYVPRK